MCRFRRLAKRVCPIPTHCPWSQTSDPLCLPPIRKSRARTSPLSESRLPMPLNQSAIERALADYDQARADYMKFLSMDPPDFTAVNAAMVAMDEAHIRFKQVMGDHDTPTHLRPLS